MRTSLSTLRTISWTHKMMSVLHCIVHFKLLKWSKLIIRAADSVSNLFNLFSLSLLLCHSELHSLFHSKAKITSILYKKILTPAASADSVATRTIRMRDNTYHFLTFWSFDLETTSMILKLTRTTRTFWTTQCFHANWNLNRRHLRSVVLRQGPEFTKPIVKPI